MTRISYDNSIDELAAVVRDELGEDALRQGVVLREAAGRLAFFVDGELTTTQRERLSEALRVRLGRYAREDRVLAAGGDPGVAQILGSPSFQWLLVGDVSVRYLDRRVVGVDWLESPSPLATGVPRAVFASLKGGVGRTTALCVAASELARQGFNVLAVDLDLEAPGLGGMLLPPSPDLHPRCGVIDYLVELSVTGEAGPVLDDMVAASILDTGRSGRVDVAPAYGTATRPEHYLGKLSRAMLDMGPDGASATVRGKVAQMVEALTARGSYDLVLLDARAGLAELTAGPLLGLGAALLLFNTAQQQSLEDLRLLLAHLYTLTKPGQGSPWTALRCVLAKATPDAARGEWFIDELYKLFQDYVYEAQIGIEGFNFAPNDPEAPHYPVPIAFNPLFADWDPARRPTDLSQSFYEATFRPFLAALEAQLDLTR